MKSILDESVFYHCQALVANALTSSLMDLLPHLSVMNVKLGQICPPPIQTALLEHDPVFVVVEVHELLVDVSKDSSTSESLL